MTEQISVVDNGSRVLIIEGAIAVGKSTLCKAIASRAVESGSFDRVHVFKESISPKMLRAYLKDQKRFAAIFQHNILFKMLNIYREAENLIRDNSRLLVIIDRGLIGNVSFAEMQHQEKIFDDIDYKLYLEEFEVDDGFAKKWSKHPMFVIVYLRCEPEIAFERMKKRGIKEEIESYTPEYFQNLHTVQDKNLSHGGIPWVGWCDDELNEDGTLKVDAVDRILDYLYIKKNI